MNAHKSDLVLHYEAADCIAELEQQNLELAAAIEAVQIDAEECLDFDECTAMLIPIDTYHALVEPAADLLAKRDQKRDAALLRATRNAGPIFTTSLIATAVERLAAARESGEWNPELEIK